MNENTEIISFPQSAEFDMAGSAIAMLEQVSTRNIDMALEACGEELIRRAVIDAQFRGELLEAPTSTLKSIYAEITGEDLELQEGEKLSLRSALPSVIDVVIAPGVRPESPIEDLNVAELTVRAGLDAEFCERLKTEPRQALEEVIGEGKLEKDAEFRVHIAEPGERILVLPIELPSLVDGLSLLRLSQCDTQNGNSCGSTCSACSTCTNCPTAARC